MRELYACVVMVFENYVAPLQEILFRDALRTVLKRLRKGVGNKCICIHVCLDMHNAFIYDYACMYRINMRILRMLIVYMHVCAVLCTCPYSYVCAHA